MILKILLIFFGVIGVILAVIAIVVALFLRQINKNGWNN